MIFVAAGTQDGRELAWLLHSSGYDVTASVVSSYGEALLSKYPGLRINDKPLDEEALTDYLTAHKVRVFVDATHPYAVAASQNAMSVCKKMSVPYVRYERKSVPIDYDNVFFVRDYDEAARESARLGHTIFLTTGSRNLKAFFSSGALKNHRVIARVLPTAEVMSVCESLGLTPKDIVAMQGPFSEELNCAMYRQYEANVIVTKNSGEIGGTDTKLSAAKKLGLPVVMITRPRIEYDTIAYTFDDVVSFVRRSL